MQIPKIKLPKLYGVPEYQIPKFGILMPEMGNFQKVDMVLVKKIFKQVFLQFFAGSIGSMGI